MNNQESFDSAKDIMWTIKEKGQTFNLPIDTLHLKGLNIGRHKTKMIIKQLPDDNVTYSVLDNHVFIHESHGGDDWKQNFMAFTVKVFMLDEYIRIHAGFYLTAMTVFYHMRENGLLSDDLIFYGYSHGAGAAPALCLRIANEGLNMPRLDGNFEPPRCILRPSKRIKNKCGHFINYIQGNDVVTKVPWWMSHLGQIRKVKGLSLPWYKKPLKMFFNHDVRP
jgi:hypothetical protein